MAVKKRKTKSFEDSMKRLEETLALYREGKELSAYCGSVLKKAEQEVKSISETLDGQYKLTDFPEVKA